MKKNILSKVGAVVIPIFIFFCFYIINKKDSEHNKYKCETKKLELKGVIDSLNHKSGYMQVHLIGATKWISLNISETIKNQGFSEYYSYEIGDSVIKKANSKEFTIKNGNKFAIYILDCDD